MIRKKSNLKKSKVLLVLALIVAVLSGQIVPVMADSGSMVSYLSPVYSQAIELQRINSDIYIEEVPGEPMGGLGEVLPATTVCSGASISSGSFVCSEFSDTEDVSQEGSGSTFSKRCNVTIAVGTYPSFFEGGDFGPGDSLCPAGEECKLGEINYKFGEWPSFSDVTGRRTPSAEYGGGEITYGEEYQRSVSVDYPPENDPFYLIPPEESALIDTEIEISGSSSNAQMEGGSSDSGEMEVGDCDQSPLANPRTECDSPIKPYDEWAEAWWSVPSEEWELSRPNSQSDVCPMISNVRYLPGCINPAGLFFSIWGILSDIECRVTGTCYENVQLMVWTDSLLGTNEGCIEPCGDMHTDAMVAAQSIPQPGRTSNREEIGQNAPVFTDRYVGTRGLCNVCGKAIPCTFVWKNWLYDEWHRMRLEQTLCVPENGDRFCSFRNEDRNGDGNIGATEEGYFEYVIRNSGGIGI